eukprot:TRINITY_DN3909_c0_g1_i1.p1 TRINITY_DN3909_c0_g1~~TRINITY_DN3909_c0_g1_i1.p1  ORF type:complete len:324 (+),score=88.73 TRINITY_DN3909_c0_g1_i1:196-1167(+)
MMLSIFIEGSSDECGFIEISEETTVSQAREMILEEIEGIPAHFRFLVMNQLTNSYVKISSPQEPKKLASILLPSAVLRVEESKKKQSINEDDQYVKEAEEKHSKRELTKYFVNNFEDSDDFIDQMWKAYSSDGKEIIIDEVPIVVYFVLGMKIDASSEAFIALQSLVINLGPNSFSSNDREAYEDPKQVFTTIIKTFAPLNGLLDRLVETMKMESFFGNFTSAAAERLIKSKPASVYLIRLSNSSAGSFAITVRSETGVHHYLIARTPDHLFLLGGGKNNYKSLDDLVSANKKRLHLFVPCKGSPFRDIFHIENIKRRYSTFE